MKPFDLEKALAGEPVVTRDGREVTQLTRFETEHEPKLRGVVDGDLSAWASTGKVSYVRLPDHPYDLFIASRKIVKWVNIYIPRPFDVEGEVYFWDTEEAADAGAMSKGRVGNKAHRIEWEE